MSAPQIQTTTIRKVLTRASGFLKTVSSHSLQPYAGCTHGKALCGVGCYVRANHWITRGRQWGGFLEVRENAAASYAEHAAAERRWARRSRGGFTIFLSSSTDPFVPQERRHHITAQVLEAMLEQPPDGLVVQTHSPQVLDVLDTLTALALRCEVRVHVSIESDRDRLPGLPPPAASVAARFAAAARLREAGLRTVITVSPLLPVQEPAAFFARIEQAADAVVLDHFVGGDGTPDGSRTMRTPLPAAMERAHPGCTSPDYRDRMVAVAQQIMPGRVGVHVDGFAGRLLPATVRAR